MKTLLDLHVSATRAAQETLTTACSHAVQTSALNAFNAEKNSPADWQYWHNAFTNQRNVLLSLQQQKAPSQIQQELAAAAAAEAAKKPGQPAK